MSIQGILIYVVVALYVGLIIYIGNKKNKEAKDKGIATTSHNMANQTISGTDLATNPAYSSLGCSIHHKH